MADTFDEIAAGLQNYIVSPLNAFGVGGYVFDVAGDTIAQLSSEITDHYTEDNRAIQDHIAIRPRRITLKGYVGELIFNGSQSDNGFLQKATQKLTVLSGYLPQLSSAAIQLQKTLEDPFNSDLTLSDAADIYSLAKNMLGSVGDQSRQQNAFLYFQALQQQGILMAIQTPWELLSNMAIEQITALQDETTKFVTDFTVIFKQIRIATTLTTAYSKASTGGLPPPGGISFQGDAALQSAPTTLLGIVPGQSLPLSSLPGAQSLMPDAHALKTIPGLENLFKVTQ